MWKAKEMLIIIKWIDVSFEVNLEINSLIKI